MSFLLGLNDTFSQIRGQVLLLDPIPLINKVFSLISQEERKKSISNGSGGVDVTNGMTFMVKNDRRHGLDNVNVAAIRNNIVSIGNNKFLKKDHPLCTHYNFHGHTIEKCYKIHGYPPGYKSKQKFNSVAANQASFLPLTADNSDHQSSHVGSFLQNLNTEQYQQLMTLLSTHLSTSAKESTQQEAAQQDVPSTSYVVGICLSASITPNFSSMKLWIIDSGCHSYCY